MKEKDPAAVSQGKKSWAKRRKKFKSKKAIRDYMSKIGKIGRAKQLNKNAR